MYYVCIIHVPHSMFVVDFILFRMWSFLFLFLIFLTWKAKTVAQDAWEFFGSQFGLETRNWRESFLKYSRTWRIEKTTRNIADFRCCLSWYDRMGTVSTSSYVFCQKARLLREMGPSDEKAAWERDEVCCTCFISNRKRRTHIAWLFGFNKLKANE